MSRLGLIEDRLEASLRFDAINGDSFERSVVASQIQEAIKELRRMRSDINKHGDSTRF